MNALTHRTTSLAPTNVGEAMNLAQMLAKSSMVPAHFRGKAEDIFVAVSWGLEVGLGPLQALNGIAVINGRPAIWGDAALALVRSHPACSGIREGVEGEGAREGLRGAHAERPDELRGAQEPPEDEAALRVPPDVLEPEPDDRVHDEVGRDDLAVEPLAAVEEQEAGEDPERGERHVDLRRVERDRREVRVHPPGELGEGHRPREVGRGSPAAS